MIGDEWVARVWPKLEACWHSWADKMTDAQVTELGNTWTDELGRYHVDTVLKAVMEAFRSPNGSKYGRPDFAVISAFCKRYVNVSQVGQEQLRWDEEYYNAKRGNPWGHVVQWYMHRDSIEYKMLNPHLGAQQRDDLQQEKNLYERLIIKNAYLCHLIPGDPNYTAIEQQRRAIYNRLGLTINVVMFHPEPQRVKDLPKACNDQDGKRGNLGEALTRITKQITSRKAHIDVDHMRFTP